MLTAWLACGLSLALCAPASAAVTRQAPFHGVSIAAADNGETAVAWHTATGGIEAAIGTPGAAYGPPATIAASSALIPSADAPNVVMDAAGNAVIVWEVFLHVNCNKGGCLQFSQGVFASLRPAGGVFGAPVRLLAGQPGFAGPRLVMNRAGDWIVLMSGGNGDVVSTGRGATASGLSALALPGFRATSVGIDEAGEATFAGIDTAGRPATAVRRSDGSFGDLAILDDAPIPDGGIALGVGPAGHAVAVWSGGTLLRWATRLPGGGFGTPQSSGATGRPVERIGVDVLGRPMERIGVDGLGRTVMTRHPAPVFPGRFELEAWRGTVSAPFSSSQRLTAADRDVAGSTGFAMSSSGTAVVSWLETERFTNPVAQAAIAVDAGPFTTPIALAGASDMIGVPGMVGIPGVATDGTGRVVLAWTIVRGDVQRIVAAAASPTAPAGPTLVAERPMIVQPIVTPPGRGSANPRQVLRIRADGTIRPRLRCESTGAACRGALRVDVRLAPGRKYIRAGTRRFVLAAGRSRLVTVKLVRVARRAATRRTLQGRITVTSEAHPGIRPSKDVTTVTVRRR